MANKMYRDRLCNQINYAIREAQAAKGIDHPGLVGRIRELAASHLFKPLLPSGFEVGTGKLCDKNGNQSDETDLVIYNKSILPPLMYSEREGLFPIEACFYSIEIKSKVTASELQDAIRKSRRVLALDYVSSSTQRARNISLVIPILFAFDSDLSDSGISELQRYAKYDPDWMKTPVLGAFCVVGRGYWYHNRKESRWFFHPATQEFDEVIDLISGIVNTLGKARMQVRQAALGLYLMLERQVKTIKT